MKTVEEKKNAQIEKLIKTDEGKGKTKERKWLEKEYELKSQA